MKLSFFLLNLLIYSICFSQTLLPIGSGAIVDRFVDQQKMIAYSDSGDWGVGENLAVVSQNARLGVFAFVEVESVEKISDRKYQVSLRLLRQSRRYMIVRGDSIQRLDLSLANPDYLGTTDLLIKSSELNISSKYRPLFYQGPSIGETAQTLYKNEFLFNYFGSAFYGVFDWLTLGTNAPANLFVGPNINLYMKFYDTDSTTLSTGLSFVQLNKENQAILNANFYWDSTSSDSLISHTQLSLGLIKWDRAAENSAVKVLTSSSFQTGYELIKNDWDRVLIGPSYNFEKKTLGGYMAYIWIFDRLHLQLSINSTDITKFKLDLKDGYYGFFDMYWRF
jgi:hypothetical protein